MSNVVIRVEGLSKKYVIRKRGGSSGEGLRHVLTDGISAPFRAVRRKLRGSNEDEVKNSGVEDFWALRDVSFEVEQGDVVGLIGRNGAGKSTLLKILSRITEPTSGRIGIKGRVASLLEVGTGFHPELTGRENIFLNGAILGMGRAEVTRKFDEIVAFAEIDKFLETPVKRYSSGMYVRLAFAVAAHLDPEILIVDEVLAVGDSQFQKKCLGKMNEVRKGGRTIFFVSHQLGAVRELCTKAVFLKNGMVENIGLPESIVAQYLNQSTVQSLPFIDKPRTARSDLISITDAFISFNGLRTSEIISSSAILLVINLRVQQEVSFSIECVLRGPDRLPIGFHSGGLYSGVVHQLKPGSFELIVELEHPSLTAGNYSIDLAVADAGIKYMEFVEDAISFQVAASPSRGSGWFFHHDPRTGSLLLQGKYLPPRRIG